MAGDGYGWREGVFPAVWPTIDCLCASEWPLFMCIWAALIECGLWKQKPGRRGRSRQRWHNVGRKMWWEAPGTVGRERYMYELNILYSFMRLPESKK